jgi:hypothetical protein
MTQVLVRYKAKPEHIAGNDQVVRAVHDELQRTESSGFQNATLQADDGATQVHMASTESDNGQTRPTADPGRHRGIPGRLGGTVVPGAALRKIPPACPPSGDAPCWPRLIPSSGTVHPTRRGTPCRRARTWRLAKEMTVKQTRIQRPRARRARPWHEALPPDPRDPDVVRAKALARSGHPRRRVPGRAVPVPRPAGP